MQKQRSIALPFSLLLVAMVSIQGGASLAKQLFPVVGSIGASALRLFFASLILLGFWRPWRHRWTAQCLRQIGLYGVALGLMNFSFYLAIERIPLGIAVALEFTGPLAIALLTSRKWTDFLWAILAAAGILTILPLTHSAGSISWIGCAYGLIAGFFWSLYIVFGQRINSGDGHPHGGHIAALGMLAATLVVFPIGLIESGGQLFKWEILPLALGVALFSSAIPYTLEMYALQRIPAKTFSILMSIEPVMAALSGLLLLHESLSVYQWLAILCIITASAGSAVSGDGSSAHSS